MQVLVQLYCWSCLNKVAAWDLAGKGSFSRLLSSMDV